MKYAFIVSHLATWPLRWMCRVLEVHPSGYYAWRRRPESDRALENRRLSGLIEKYWRESGKVYGHRKLHQDLRDAGERCGRHRVLRLMRRAGLRAEVGCRRRPRHRSGPAHAASPDRLRRQFTVPAPDRAWVTDITHIRTHEGWLYLAVVLDLFSRRVIGWSMGPRMTRDLALDALRLAIGRRRPRHPVTVHSDQGSQYTSRDWQALLQAHGMRSSMSRRGNCLDNAVAESFFQLLKRERVRGQVYASRKKARNDIFDYIEWFYNVRRRHGAARHMPPAAYERRHFERMGSVY